MTDFAVIQAVSAELRRQIIDVLGTTPDADFGIEGDEDRIALESPGSTLAAGTVASLYLYHVEIDGHLRNQRPLPDRSADDLFRKPPLPLRLRFLFTPVGDEEATNLFLLGRVLQHFHDSPAFSTLDGTAVGDSHGGASSRLKVRIDLLPMAELTQLWSAFTTPFRLSISLLVEVVAIDSARLPVRLPRTEEVAVGYGQSGRRQK